MLYSILALALIGAQTAVPAAFSRVSTVSKSLAPGVTLTQEVYQAPALLVDVLTVDPTKPGVVVAPAVANDSLTNGTGDIRKGRENVSTLVARKGLLAAVNGDYFPYTGDPLGLGVMNGAIYSEPFVSPSTPGRAAIGWLPGGRVIVGIPALAASIKAQDGTTMPISGVNRPTAQDNPSDAVVYVRLYGPTSGARGNGTEIVLANIAPIALAPGRPVTGTVSAIVSASPAAANIPDGGVVVSVPAGSPLAAQITAHFHVGEAATVTVGLKDITPIAAGDPGGSWNDVKQAIGGGPILLHHGQVVVDDTAESLGASFSTAPHARTSVGARADGKIVIATADSGSALSAGVSLRDMALLMQREGAIDAINLDGGGSTTMVAQGLTVNFPNGSAYERPVADMLTVAAVDPPLPAIDAPSIVVPAALQVGQSYPLSLLVGSKSLRGFDPTVLWNGPVADVGFVTQDGVLHILHPGHGTITASVQGVKTTASIDVAAPAQPSAPSPGSQAQPAETDDTTPANPPAQQPVQN